MQIGFRVGAATWATGWGIAAGPVAAWWRCPPPPCLPAPVHVEERVVTRYRPEYRTEYRDVQRTVYRCVPETREQEIRETVQVPHWREKGRERNRLIPHTHQERPPRTAVT